MPYAKGRRTTSRKRYTRGSRTRSTRSRTYRRKTYRKVGLKRTRWTNPLSQSKLVRFAYSDTLYSVSLTALNNYTAMHVFRGNSIFDPDYTGVGIQPFQFDQLCYSGGYTNYRVSGSSIKVYFRTGAEIRRLHAFVIPMRIAAPSLTDVNTIRNLPFHKETTYDSAQESTRGARLSHYCTLKRLSPDFSPQDADAAAYYTANPNLLFYWCIIFYADGISTTTSVYFDIKLRYYTKLARTDLPIES